MKAIRIAAPYRIEVTDVPAPTPKEGEALLRDMRAYFAD